MLKLFRRRPPTPPSYQSPPPIEIVETFDGYLIRRGGTDDYAWFANADVPHWHPRDWNDRARPGNWVYSLYRTQDLEKARAARVDIVDYMHREAAREHERAVAEFNRTHYPERVVD